MAKSKQIEEIGQRRCPHCGGLHYGQRFDDCCFVRLVNDETADEDRRANARSILATHNPHWRIDDHPQ